LSSTVRSGSRRRPSGNDRDAGLADALRAAAGEFCLVEEDGPGLGSQDAADGQDQGGFARAVRAEEGGDLAGRDLDSHLLDHGAAAAFDGKVRYLEGAHAIPR